jgi:hypothetical protein
VCDVLGFSNVVGVWLEKLDVFVSKKLILYRFSLLHRACCFHYFFNIPTYAPIVYTLNSIKFTLTLILLMWNIR